MIGVAILSFLQPVFAMSIWTFGSECPAPRHLSTWERVGRTGRNGLSLRCCILLACLGKSFCWITDSGLRNEASVWIKMCLWREWAKILPVYSHTKTRIGPFPPLSWCSPFSSSPPPHGLLNFRLYPFNGNCTTGHGLPHLHLSLSNIYLNPTRLKRKMVGISWTNNLSIRW